MGQDLARGRCRRRMGRAAKPPAGWRAARDRGSVTAELAITLPAVVLVLALVLTLGAVSVAQLRVTDAARAGARAAAIGHSNDQVHQIVTERAGEGALVQVGYAGDQAVVSVTRPILGPAWGSWQVTAQFATTREPEP